MTDVYIVTCEALRSAVADKPARRAASRQTAKFKQEISSCWDGRSFGHNRHEPKVGRGCCGVLGPHLTQCGLGRGLPLYQVASWSIQPFGHNCRNAMLLRVGLCLWTIFIPSLVVKTFTGCVHWVIARYQLLTQVNNVLELSEKHSKWKFTR